MAANPFYIDPWAGQSQNIAQGLAGLGSVVRERREEKQNQELRASAQEIFERGNPDEIAQFMIANPEIGKQAAGGMQFASELTEKNLVESAKRVLSSEDPEAVLTERIRIVQEQGGDPSDSIEALQEYREDPEGFMAGAEKLFAMRDPQGHGAWKKAAGASSAPIGTEEARFNRLLQGLSPKEQELAKRIELGLAPRATGSAAQTIAATGATGEIAQSESIIAGAKAGAKEAAKLGAQFKLKPAVESAVAEAVAVSKMGADAAGEDRSNSRALSVYNTAMGALSSAMDEAYTGPIAGLVPAMTANAQIADGAVAAMAPVLKQMFRAAGEGVFTDKDQELLLGMVPTRKDLPEARAAKIRNIDAIVRAKLGSSEVVSGSDRGAVSSEDPDQAALNWARANPGDPRAAEILRIQGAQ